MERHRIPKYLHSYPQFLWWEMDEFLIFLVFMFTGIMVNKAIIGGLAGFIVTKLYVKMKETKQDGFIKHVAYAFGLYNIKGKLPEYWVKEILS